MNIEYEIQKEAGTQGSKTKGTQFPPKSQNANPVGRGKGKGKGTIQSTRHLIEHDPFMCSWWRYDTVRVSVSYIHSCVLDGDMIQIHVLYSTRAVQYTYSNDSWEGKEHVCVAKSGDKWSGMHSKQSSRKKETILVGKGTVKCFTCMQKILCRVAFGITSCKRHARDYEERPAIAR